MSNSNRTIPSRRVALIGLLQSVCGALVVLLGGGLLVLAKTGAVVDVLGAAGMAGGGVGLLVAGLITVRKRADTDPSAHRPMSWLAAVSYGLVLAGALLPRLL
jgi:hypothetical protein